MWETIAIIVTLGGLEFALWLLDQREAKRDHEMQQKQLEILDGILTELAIQNSQDVHNSVLSNAGTRGDEHTANNTGHSQDHEMMPAGTTHLSDQD